MTSDGAEHRLTWDECETGGIAWSPGGDSLIVSSRREGDIDNLWRISLSNLPPVRLTETGEVITWPAVSRRGERLAYVRRFMDPVAGEPGALADHVMVVEDFR
jgi:Tol biopolymer transport system component